MSEKSDCLPFGQPGDAKKCTFVKVRSRDATDNEGVGGWMLEAGVTKFIVCYSIDP
ncbi:MAG: hypothetical protein K9G76_10480 [Bacteroidales bacterium]|nr:hypothetical protein [Bacteroidales bacterium]MCF8405780.1 hypothetical protein [Bacteroidales bacterium]